MGLTMATLTKKDLVDAIKDVPSEKKNNFLTSSYPSGANAQQAYRSKYDESII